MMRNSSMTIPNQGANAPAVDAVLGALERLAVDLRRRTEDAERRAAEAEARTERERRARQDAEARAAVAEEKAGEAHRRADAVEAAARESLAQMRQDLLAAIRESVEVARATAATIEAAVEPAYPAEE